MNKDLSGLLGYILLLGGVAVVAMAILGKKEQFVPEFLDQGNVKQTAKTGTSSYAQETNHFKLTPPVPEPISGSQTPFRVNMFTAYME
jgi:flagellar basal body-associated protein FliL